MPEGGQQRPAETFRAGHQAADLEQRTKCEQGAERQESGPEGALLRKFDVEFGHELFEGVTLAAGHGGWLQDDPHADRCLLCEQHGGDPAEVR